MADKKNVKTKATIYAEIKDILKDLYENGKLEQSEYDEYTERLDKDIELATKKSTATKKPTENDKLNMLVKEAILTVLENEGKAMKYADFYKAVLAELETTEDKVSKNKVTALCTQLGEKGTGEIKKYVEKKITYIVLASLA